MQPSLGSKHGFRPYASPSPELDSHFLAASHQIVEVLASTDLVQVLANLCLLLCNSCWEKRRVI